MAVTRKTSKELAIMRQAGRILAETFEVLAGEVKVGVSAAFLDRTAEECIRKHGAEPSFLGYSGYKYSTCISKNEEIVHGIPYKEKVLLPGDICGIDIGVCFQGYHADAARTFVMEPVDPLVEKLVTVTEEAFFIGIQEARPGKHMGDVSSAMQSHIERNNLTVVRDLYSHGIGRDLHEDPLIPNYGDAGKGILLHEGMTFAIEPMVNLGVSDILTLADKWTIITADKKWSAHYENTIAIMADGPEILTIR